MAVSYTTGTCLQFTYLALACLLHLGSYKGGRRFAPSPSVAGAWLSIDKLGSAPPDTRV